MTDFAAASKELTADMSECFLCSLDPHHHCHTPVLKGRLLGARERTVQKEHIPYILLDTGSEHVEVQLEERYYRSLVRELHNRRAQIAHLPLTVHVYHLPTAPETVTYETKSRLRYRANSYTLAVLEPDILLNITDLNEAEYCTRQYLLKRMIPSGGSFEMLRGNLVHHCFTELLKEHDHGKFNNWSSSLQQLKKGTTQESPLQAMKRYLEEQLQQEATGVEVALANVSFDEVRQSVLPHLESLASWYESERHTLWTLPGMQDDANDSATNQVRAETFLLAPEIGLRGRLDLFWQHEGQQRLLELKTGGASGILPKREHLWQVYGYHALLAVRKDPRLKRAFATLVYSGKPGHAEAVGIRASIRDLQRVNERRMILVLDRLTGIPSAPPGPHKCSKCRLLEDCRRISDYLGWQPPITEEEDEQPSSSDEEDKANESTAAGDITNIAHAQPATTPRLALLRPAQRIAQAEDREFFSHYFHLLQLEGAAEGQQQTRLWLLPPAERLAQGSTIQGLEPLGMPASENDGWSQSYRCNNTSELREGDEILLSDGDPVTGEVVSGTIMKVNSDQITVWTRELITHPWLIDRYENDLIHIRTLQNLLRWQNVSTHLHDLVAGRIHPRFIFEDVMKREDFNREQNLAIERALEMRDYLLIHGPPGTGKTSVIAEIVKRLTARGEKIMLGAFTNQAVDNMLKRLLKEGESNFLRLGSRRSINNEILPYTLHRRIEQALKTYQEQKEQTDSTANDQRPPVAAQVDFARPHDFSTIVFDILQRTPIVATTTATWSSDRYLMLDSQTDTQAQDNTAFLFDVAIIDEAGQLTVPAILGALRFARRFILVGDEKQLPPLVQSQQAIQEGLSDSLFSQLKRYDEEFQQQRPMEISACVPLRIQYRMNKWISHFASTVFYDKQLRAHPSIANRRLHYHRSDTSDVLTTSSGSGDEAEHLHRQARSKVLDPRFPLVFVDVREKDAQAEQNESHLVNASSGKQSDAEARTVRTIIQELLTRGIEPEDIGVIAPYRAQVANIRRHLMQDDPQSSWQALPANTPLSVDTVDRFQGGERQVILISFATHQTPSASSPRYDFLTDAHRLNVALTRAQCKLILVGNIAALKPLPIFDRLITYCQSMQTIVNKQPDVAADEYSDNASLHTDSEQASSQSDSVPPIYSSNQPARKA